MGGGGSRERDRQTERPLREEVGGARTPQASSNLWHGKKEELAPSASVCALTPQR